MTVPFTKLFSSITTSTIWREDDHTRLLWVTMLAMADKNGVVITSLPGLADMARVPMEAAVKSIAKLSGPDEWSSSQEFEGRRIEKVDRGWKLLNYAKFRAMREVEERREYMRGYMKDYRKKDVNNVSNVNSSKPKLAQAETEAEAEADSRKQRKSNTFVRPALSEIQTYCLERKNKVDAQQFLDYYEANGWKVGRNSMRDWKATVRYWETNSRNGTRPDKVADFMRRHGVSSAESHS